MPKLKQGKVAPPSLTKRTADTIRAAGQRNGFRYDYQLGDLIGVDKASISRRLKDCTFTHKEIVTLNKALQFTEEEWRALGCR